MQVKRGEDGSCREAPKGKLQELMPSSFLCLPSKCVGKRGRVRRIAGVWLICSCEARVGRDSPGFCSWNLPKIKLLLVIRANKPDFRQVCSKQYGCF